MNILCQKGWDNDLIELIPQFSIRFGYTRHSFHRQVIISAQWLTLYLQLTINY